MSSKIKIASALALILVIFLISIAYLHFKRQGDILILKIGNYLSQKTGRKSEIGSIEYSLFNGVILKNVVIKEKDGKRDFLKFEKAEIRINEREFIKGKLIFEKAKFYSGKLRLENKNGKWNFEDLLKLLPPSNRPIHLIWNAKELSFDNFEFYFSDPQKIEELSLSKSSLVLLHRSSVAGDFFISFNGFIGTLINKKLFSCELALNSNLIYDYSEMKSAKIKAVLNKISYDQIYADSVLTEFEVFNINKKEHKNFNGEIAFKNMFIPYSNESYQYMLKTLGKLEKALGRDISLEKEFLLKEMKASISAKNLEAKINISLNSNLLDLLFSSHSSFIDKKDEIKLEIQAGYSKINIDAISDFSNVELKQQLSETAQEAIKNGILEFENKVILKLQ